MAGLTTYCFPLPTIFLLPLLLNSLLCNFAFAQIRLGSVLQPSSNSGWASPNNTFTFGFIVASDSNNHPSSYSAAITYTDVPVWKAGGDSAIVDSNARFELLSNGNLRLSNGSGATIWESNTANRGVTAALLDDSGNLSLTNGSTTVWSTFDYPTDTILPGQNFTTGKVLRSGLYSFNLQNSGNLTLRWNQDVIYWNEGLNNPSSYRSLSSPGLVLQPIGILQLYDSTFSAPAVMAYSSDYAEGTNILRFVRLDSDGNLRIYSSARGSGIITERWAAVADQCRVFGWCGNMGICSYNASMPICGCPSDNFELVDPKNSRKGCKRKVEIRDCPGSATMLQLNHTQFLTFPPELSSQVFFVGISACRLNCLVARSCVASTSLSDGTGLCYFKNSNFVSGYQSPALPSTSFVKVCGAVKV